MDESDHREEEDNIYKRKSRRDLVDNDEISPEEEAFMGGYEGDEEIDEELVEVNENDEDY